MKPFRGKPEKPKRSNGEIHRRRRSATVGARCSGRFHLLVPLARARHHRIEHSGVVVVHFSPSRTSRPVVCRSTARVGACRVVSAHAADPRSPGRLHDGTLTVSGRNQSILECVCVHPAASSVSSYPGRYGPSAVPGPGQLLAVRCPRTGQIMDYRSATLLLWVLSGPVLKHGPRSLTCARVIGMHKPKGEMKVKVGLRADRGRMGRVTMRPRTPGASRSHCEKRRT